MKRVKVISILLIIALSLTTIFTTFRIIAFDQTFYHNQFERNHLYDTFEKEYILNTTSILVDYLKHEKSNTLINSPFFNNEEKLHMLEVKNKIQTTLYLANIILLLTLALFNAFIYEKERNFQKILMCTGILNLVIIILPLISLLLNFNLTFTLFHNLLSFDKWQFPYTSNMIQMFPARFFFDMGVRIILSIITLSAVFIAFSLYLKRKYYKQKTINKAP